MRNNKQRSVRIFLLLHLGALCVFWILYQSTIFVSIRGMTLRSSMCVLLAMILVFSLPGMILTFRRRTWVNLCGNVMTPFVVYTFVSYGSRDGIPALIWAFTGVWGILSAALFVLFFTDGGRQKRFPGWLFLRSRNILALMLLGVFIPSIIFSSFAGRNLLIGDGKSPDAASAHTEDGAFCSTPEITDLLHHENRSDSETLQLLQAVVDNETAYWGLPYTLTVKVRPLAENVLSEYLNNKRQIVINEDRISDLSDPTLLYAVLKQVYHSVQITRVQAYRQIDPDLRTARFFRTEEVWSYEFSHYQPNDGQSYSFDEAAEEFALYRAAEYLYAADHSKYRSA